VTNQVTNQINTQEVIKKEFLNIFEVSHLFDVSAITVRRYIKNIFEQIAIAEDKLNLSTQNDKTKLYRELEALSNRARKRVIGQTKAGESIYLLELANKEAFANWQLRPTIKAVIQENENLVTQEATHIDSVGSSEASLSTQKPDTTIHEDNQASTQEADQASNRGSDMSTQEPEERSPKTENIQWVANDGFSQKYIQLLETQLSEKDDTIKDLRETNKFLSITNGKLNEHLRLLLEKPEEPTIDKQ
jgi:hypothetical protein